MPSKGFTLAEVLIALALISVVAAFSIPKILLDSQKQHYNAMSKEVLGIGATAMQLIKQKNPGLLVVTTTTFDSYFNALTKPALATCDIISPGVSGLDIDGNGLVNSADTQLIINAINASAPYNQLYDVNGDGMLTAIDALTIINYINAGAPPITPDVCYTFGNGSTLSLGQFQDGGPIGLAFKPGPNAQTTDLLYFSIRSNGRPQTLGQQKQNSALDPSWFKW